MTKWRYIAQRALTGEFLDWDLPFERDELTWELSGAGALRATTSPDVGHLRGSDGRLILEEWGTLIYAEADGRIRWGGVVIRSAFDGPQWNVEAAGFSTYPHGMPYTGDFVRTQVDPLAVVREVWAHLQAHPEGDLGMVVDSKTSPVRLGTPAVKETVTQGKRKVTRVVTEAEPYVLGWWEPKDCGDEILTLARETPFDFVEDHRWTGEGNAIEHRLRLGYPRLGTKRTDVVFVQGENVSQVVPVSRDGDLFASEVLALGAGEGRKTLRRVSAKRDTGRLRRTAVWSDKSATRKAALDAAARAELARRRGLLEISKIEVVQHPHARIGSWQLGDDVMVRADLPWLGEVGIWSRIVAWSLVNDDRAELTLVRSDRFDYSGGQSS